MNYKDEEWEERLLGLLPSQRRQLDTVIDGASGGIVEKAAKLLKASQKKQHDVW